LILDFGFVFMNSRLQSIDVLIREFAKMPTIGRRTAQKLAFYILKLPHAEALQVARAITDVKEKVRACAVCYNITEQEQCDICRDTRRERDKLCVVETAHDVMALEKTGLYHGLYHVLGGVLSPMEGVQAHDLKIEELLQRVTPEIKEVVLATNPSSEGEATAHYVAKLLAGRTPLVTRIALGLPMGSELEFSDSLTLAKAMERRMQI
jgi:recombination protein RecR